MMAVLQLDWLIHYPGDFGFVPKSSLVVRASALGLLRKMASDRVSRFSFT